jgi:threonine aldolase
VTPSPRRGFASDNSATVHPEVLSALARVNVGHVFGYGHDDYTKEIERRVGSQFGADARVYFVFNGSGANILALRAACRPAQAVICCETSHMNVDECGAPEAIAGVKLLTVTGRDGKLTPELIERRIERVGDEHAVQPRLVSISQCTELGTLYSYQELLAVANAAHGHGLLLHVDGARLCNAAAATGLRFSEMTSEVGVDVVSFGGTKNGLLGAEAVVLLRPDLADGFEYLRKQTLQLGSKMRYLAAQFEALFTEEMWLRCARHANAMAAKLAQEIGRIPDVSITRPVQSNAVFATMPEAARVELQQDFDFYVWDEATGEVRWMCSWDTTTEDVETFADALAAVVA